MTQRSCSRNLSSGGHEFKLRDWRLEKVEGIPELEKYQKRLAQQGLKDPFIRNLCHLYDPKRGYLPKHIAFLSYWTNGIGVGLCLTGVCICIQQIKKRFRGSEDEHHS
ncbi:hypothetical protein ACOME3_007006 [Neoechinorhynchus agilis]